MTRRINKGMRLFLGVTASVLFYSATASADIYTFWKTNECPKVPDKKLQHEMPGIMEAPGTTAQGGVALDVGGAFCTLLNHPLTSVAGLEPKLTVFKYPVRVAIEDVHAGKALREGEIYNCVVCWYTETIVGLPTLSALGTAMLIGGLLTAVIIQVRRRQVQGAM